MLFQDQTDRNRFVEIVPGKIVPGAKQMRQMGRLYWEKDGYFLFGGLISVPIKLFEKEARIAGHGFVRVPD